MAPRCPLCGHHLLERPGRRPLCLGDCSEISAQDIADARDRQARQVLAHIEGRGTT